MPAVEAPVEPDAPHVPTNSGGGGSRADVSASAAESKGDFKRTAAESIVPMRASIERDRDLEVRVGGHDARELIRTSAA